MQNSVDWLSACCLASSLALTTACLHKSFIPKNLASWFLAQLLHLCPCSCLLLQYLCHLTLLLVLTALPFLKNLAQILFSSYTIQSSVMISSSDLLYQYLALNFATCIKIPGFFNGVVGSSLTKLLTVQGRKCCTTQFLALGFAKNNNKNLTK